MRQVTSSSLHLSSSAVYLSSPSPLRKSSCLKNFHSEWGFLDSRANEVRRLWNFPLIWVMDFSFRDWRSSSSAAFLVLLFLKKGDSLFHKQGVSVKPWANGLASRHKSTQVCDLRSICVSFGHPLAWTCDNLCWLALTCVDFGRAQIWTQVFYRLATQRKSTQVDRK